MSRSPAFRVATPAEVAAEWPRRLLEIPLLVVDRLDSTQHFSRLLIDHLAAEDEEIRPCFMVALEQTSGRGRRGRPWVSGAGRGLWASLILVMPSSEVATVPMRAATALAEGLATVVQGVRLKWPNDLVAGHRKLGGILVDVIAREQERVGVVVGFGVNLEPPLSPPEPAAATSLRDMVGEGKIPTLGGLAVILASKLAGELEAMSQDWLSRYRELATHRAGDQLVCDLEGERLVGRFAGFDERGFLRLDTPEGERILASGEVFAW